MLPLLLTLAKALAIAVASALLVFELELELELELVEESDEADGDGELSRLTVVDTWSVRMVGAVPELCVGTLVDFVSKGLEEDIFSCGWMDERMNDVDSIYEMKMMTTIALNSQRNGNGGGASPHLASRHLSLLFLCLLCLPKAAQSRANHPRLSWSGQTKPMELQPNKENVILIGFLVFFFLFRLFSCVLLLLSVFCFAVACCLVLEGAVL